MKDTYIIPDLDIIVFTAEDIITTSSGINNDPNDDETIGLI